VFTITLRGWSVSEKKNSSICKDFFQTYSGDVGALLKTGVANPFLLPDQK